LGYPENGPFDAQPGRIGTTQRIITDDAYGRGPVTRLLTPLRGLVRPGNSGGPLVDRDGRVGSPTPRSLKCLVAQGAWLGQANARRDDAHRNERLLLEEGFRSGQSVSGHARGASGQAVEGRVLGRGFGAFLAPAGLIFFSACVPTPVLAVCVLGRPTPSFARACAGARLRSSSACVSSSGSAAASRRTSSVRTRSSSLALSRRGPACLAGLEGAGINPG
jgi:hypothetical protein